MSGERSRGGEEEGRRGGSAPHKMPAPPRRNAGRLFIFPFERAGVLSQPRREPIASPSVRQPGRPLEESAAVLSPRGIVCQTHKRGSNISTALRYAGIQKLRVWTKYGGREREREKENRKGK